MRKTKNHNKMKRNSKRKRVTRRKNKTRQNRKKSWRIRSIKIKGGTSTGRKSEKKIIYSEKMQKFLNNKTLPRMNIIKNIFKDREIQEDLRPIFDYLIKTEDNIEINKTLAEFDVLMRIDIKNYFPQGISNKEKAKIFYTFEKLKNYLSDNRKEIDPFLKYPSEEIINKIEKNEEWNMS
jgi:hypothetical protein